MFRRPSDPKVSLYATTGSADEVGMYRSNSGMNELSLEQVAAAVKKSLGYLEKPLVKCRHCGQWGAAYCACLQCGAPIDP